MSHMCTRLRAETRKLKAARRTIAATQRLNALVAPYNNVRRLASAAMRQRHAHLQHAPKNASQFAEYDCVKRAAVARFEVLSRAHTVERQHEEVENIMLGTRPWPWHQRGWWVG